MGAGDVARDAEPRGRARDRCRRRAARVTVPAGTLSGRKNRDGLIEAPSKATSLVNPYA